jgi:chromosome segregation ATPase
MQPEQIVAWITARKITAEARTKLEAIVAKKRETAAAAADIQRQEKRLASIESDENRLRSSIQTLNSVPGQQEQVQRYATDLSKKETEIQDVHARLELARKKQATLEEELATLVEKLSF